jgi:TetR/AcrR family transcriptional regulator
MECKTEEQIKQFAKELFFSKGVLDASTQEIADFAGVNRTLVNYYFRSKKNLFHVVYSEAILEMRANHARIYSASIPFREKVEALIDYSIEFREVYPFLEIFNIRETSKLTNQLETVLQPKSMIETKLFLDEIKAEMQKGTIPTYEPVNFLINIISLISFPIVMKPIFREIFCISSEEEYKRIYNQRKEMVLAILFNKEKQ